MPAYLAQYETNGDPAEPLDISGLSGGQTSATFTKEIWNDKDLSHIDAETSRDQFMILLAALGANPYISGGATLDYPTGLPILEERWGVFRIVKYLTQDGETDDYVTGSRPIGTNSAIPLPDLAPGTGIRYEIFFRTPAGQTAQALKVLLRAVGNQASTPLSSMVTLAHGSGVMPADRVSGLRALLRGGIVTADDTATVDVSGWLQTYDGTNTAKLDTSVTFTLADGDSVDLDADESYLVTLSITSAGTITTTKGPKTELVNYPSKPADDVFLTRLIVTSADGIAVTVAQADVDQSLVKYAQFFATDAGGLTIRIHGGDGTTATDFRQYKDNTVDVALTASSTNRIWRLAAGTWTKTTTDAPPEFGADLLWYVTTDAGAITGIVDARKFMHRALVMDRIELVYRAVFADETVPAHGVALAYAHGDFEIESVDVKLTATDGTWTAGALKIDVRYFAPGAAVPYPAGGLGTGGASIFTSSGTVDKRPSIAYDATSLRASTDEHEVRRIVKDTALLLSLIGTVTGAGGEPEQELRVTLNVRRYR